MKLSQLQNGEEGVIVKVKGHGAFRKRIIEMGFVRGKKVTVIKNAPLHDPVEYKILDYQVSLRRSEAALIEVITKEEAKTLRPPHFQGTITDDILKQSATEKRKTINIALVGNPNCGKTTLFNFASGAREHVGNYSGVTIDVKHASFSHNGYNFNISDLPGTYSLSAYSPEELYVREHILKETPDIVINVMDASNLERNLYLTTQLIDMDIKVVVALNMFDELQKRGDILDYHHLGKMLGIPFIPTIGSKGKGVNELFEKIIDVYEDQDPVVRHIHINYGEILEKRIDQIEQIFKSNGDLKIKMSPRFIAIKSLEKDRELKQHLERKNEYTNILEALSRIITKTEHQVKEDTETFITDTKYGFIAGALKETYKENPRVRRRKTDIIDTFITHRLFGIPLFIFFMWLMFQSTFTLGEHPMNWIKQGVEYLSNSVHTWMPEGPLKDLIIDGIIGGVGGVIVFLPNILILFFFISFMEDTGYMARAAFIMDKIMHKMGLHGKSFIPLIMGFGCNVPAIMATRTIEDRNNRILTMLINPFMSCSARLPVYILIIGAFFPEKAGTVLFSIYGTGILLAVLVARVFKKHIFKGDEVPFVMELPPYRIPTLKSTIRHMWHKGQQYLRKMGGIILVASIIIWFLGYFPRHIEYSQDYKGQIETITNHYSELAKNDHNQLQTDKWETEKTNAINTVLLKKESERQQKSYIGRLGKWIEPALSPLGFDWKMGVSLVSGIAAKEVVVSTMSVLYQTNDSKNDHNALIQQLQNDTYEDGSKVFSPIVALSFLVFTLIYFPCVAVIAAIRKESGSWKWALFTIGYTTALAWGLSFLVYQIGSLIV
ncbi:ferrous iron transport protein B [Marinilabiliaceae bacterium JC017]|nr:ferrous iron transport protein B [Marinilabiliaceae bacterium JC017]